MSWKAPTIGATLEIIRAMGLRANYEPAYEEFRISYPGNSESTYYTDSRIDAILTAREMSKRKDHNG